VPGFYGKDTLDEMAVGRTEAPLGYDPKPVKRERIGAG
jgi:hypothetical protein